LWPPVLLELGLELAESQMPDGLLASHFLVLLFL
jgi:hypothetical protein